MLYSLLPTTPKNTSPRVGARNAAPPWMVKTFKSTLVDHLSTGKSSINGGCSITMLDHVALPKGTSTSSSPAPQVLDKLADLEATGDETDHAIIQAGWIMGPTHGVGHFQMGVSIAMGASQ